MYTGGMPHHGESREWWSAVRGLNNNNNNNNNVMVVGGDPLEMVAKVAAENAVVIVSESSCCMCHAVKQLFCGMGVNPTVYELDHDPRGKDIERALTVLLGRRSPVVPVVFVGGKLVGAVDRVMASHINGTLVPLLKQAGALWL